MEKNQSSKAIDKKSAEIKIVNPECIKPKFSNYVQITHTPHEFTINFCYFDKLEIDQGKKNHLDAEVISRIVISPSFFPNVLNAFQANMKKYNESIESEIEKTKKQKGHKK